MVGCIENCRGDEAQWSTGQMVAVGLTTTAIAIAVFAKVRAATRAPDIGSKTFSGLMREIPAGERKAVLDALQLRIDQTNLVTEYLLIEGGARLTR